MASKYGKKAQDKVEKTMHERKKGTLRSGSGKKVTSRKQAIAIGLSEARREGGKVPAKKSSSTKSSSKGTKKSSGTKSSSSKSSRKSTSKKSTPRKSSSGTSARKSTSKKSSSKSSSTSAKKK
jgi:hypothetical protein